MPLPATLGADENWHSGQMGTPSPAAQNLPLPGSGSYLKEKKLTCVPLMGNLQQPEASCGPPTPTATQL